MFSNVPKCILHDSFFVSDWGIEHALYFTKSEVGYKKNVMCRFSKCNVFYVPFTTISFFFGGLHSDQDIYDIRHIAILL